MRLLYSIGIGLYRLGIGIASLKGGKAKKWIEGRKGWAQRCTTKQLEGCIWMHAASTGEFEQGLPVLKLLKEQHPDRKVLITFFSPSGFEAKKQHPIADHIEYLPLDTEKNAAEFYAVVKPACVLFIKYEFWLHFLEQGKDLNVPLFLVSGIFRKEQAFFKWWGGLHRDMLDNFHRCFLQDQQSMELFESVGKSNCELSGDTRFDRVLEIANSKSELPLGKAFERASDLLTVVAGSTWPADEDKISKALDQLSRPVRLIIAPHELEADKIAAIEHKFPQPIDRWSRLSAVLQGLFDPRNASFPKPDFPPNGDPLDLRTLVIDEMGLLSRIYRYGDVAYVGGGFGSGIHNTLEAAVHGMPVIFGPNHERFKEAQGLIDAGAAWSISSAEELRSILEKIINDSAGLERASSNARDYVERNAGASRRIAQVVGMVLSNS